MTRVLAVDDDPRVLRVERAALTRAGFEVSSASCTAEAREALAREAPAIVLVDLHLGAESGLAFLEALRHEGFSGRLVAISGDALEREAEDAGADAFLPKPFSPSDLVACVRRLTAPAPSGEGL
jgi:two-component system KDP operon response regulator KdpE